MHKQQTNEKGSSAFSRVHLVFEYCV